MANTIAAAANPEDSNHGAALSAPQRLMKFFHDTREEMRKVVTPTREQVQSSTIIVIVTVFIFAAYFELVDAILGNGIDKLFLHLTKH